MCILEPSPYYGLSIKEREKAIKYDIFKEEELWNLYKLKTIEDIPEFKPLVEHCHNWIKETSHNHLSISYQKDIVSRNMKFYHWEYNGVEFLHPAYICKTDILDNSEKWNIWCDCFAEYLKRRGIETNYEKNC